MESLYINTVDLKYVPKEVENIFTEKYQLTNSNLLKSVDELTNYLGHLTDDLIVMVEYPYVDKTYRDTYYNYYASKKDEYPRNSIRLSFLKTTLPDEFFRSGNAGHLKAIEENYLGFLILRPTFPFIIGRSL